MSTYNPRCSWPQPSMRRLSSVGPSFIEAPSQMSSVVVLDIDNVSLVFHEGYESDMDDFSKYDYSVDAPSYLCEKPSRRRLDSTACAANHNISQYFTVEARDDEAVCHDDFDDSTIASQQPAERPALKKEDSILGSLPALIPNKPKAATNEKKELIIVNHDHKTYADKLLGIDDESQGTMQTTSLDVSMNASNEPGYESPVEKKNKVKRWFGNLGKKEKNKNKKDKTKNRRSNIFQRSQKAAAPRRAPPKRSVSDLRRASF